MKNDINRNFESGNVYIVSEDWTLEIYLLHFIYHVSEY